MVLWGHQRSWDEERQAAPAGATGAAPPPFLVYKSRLYVLAKKAPVLDHHQVDIDSVFGPADEATHRPALPARPPTRTAVHPPAARNARSHRRPPPGNAGTRPRDRRPRFVPRDP